ncbi:tyrosine-type recombinase/integrase [Burkholderia gladioli]|uniref:tyrosine-type recombinase/integrase n=1 Tax=Burkholderia gladioli TaxID=28095 RepID=UPI001641A00C|nr:integrase arm-type DNA-binding domain-containing protein [Burkholderia gladioli]MBU9268755.1 tyrosine-type recombinase/integrase [Burkholderia gladioli]MCH7268252.1 tyrosine-type recombinase/integrase [Burkholderia gladioli]MDN7805430.1 tyrosine-type recombinase/integrase [Burkholderia gladioli]MEB2548796.1 tyrosine-type recombinase/integrase [Burkholderia gladioli]
MLTDKQAKALKPGDKPVFDGKITGLFLSPAKWGCKWTLRFVSPVTGKRRDAGLGSYPEVSISEARERAQQMRKLIDAGEDPIEQRNRERDATAIAAAELTFEKAARKVHEELKPGWKNAKHAAQWISTLETYAFPKLGARKLDAVTPGDCADVLRPIWLTKAETASRTRQRMHAVMQWAWAHGHITANPLTVVDHLLPKQSTKAEHQPAMPWRQIPAFVETHLASSKTTDGTRAALLFLILTAARSSEVRGATWDEIDLHGAVWNIPASRMKAKEAHRVPLSGHALALLKAVKATGLHDMLVFPSPQLKTLSDMSLTALLRRVKAESGTLGRCATAHGFRSSFRDWASEQGYSRDLAERALAHTVANKVEAAYHRTDLLEQRRPLMEAWARHVHSN